MNFATNWTRGSDVTSIIMRDVWISLVVKEQQCNE